MANDAQRWSVWGIPCIIPPPSKSPTRFGMYLSWLLLEVFVQAITLTVPVGRQLKVYRQNPANFWGCSQFQAPKWRHPKVKTGSWLRQPMNWLSDEAQPISWRGTLVGYVLRWFRSPEITRWPGSQLVPHNWCFECHRNCCICLCDQMPQTS